MPLMPFWNRKNTVRSQYRKSLIRQTLEGVPFMHILRRKTICWKPCVQIFLKTHDFSEGNRGMAERLTHLLYHLKDNRTNIRGIFACESGELFMDYFKEYLRTLFDQYMDCFDQNVPKDFVLNHLAGSFAEAVRWWMKNHMEPEPEMVAGYYIHLI